MATDPRDVLKQEQAKQDLIDSFNETGNLVIDQDALNSLGPVDQGEPEPLVEKDVEANVPKIADSDLFMQENTDNSSKLLEMESSYLPEVVTITPADKASFVDAILADSRYMRPFSFYGDKVTGTFRSRTVEEHDAIAVYLSKLMIADEIKNDAEYYRHLRALSFTAQVAKFNGVEFNEMQKPLLANDDGTEPGWLNTYRRWLDRDNQTPGLTAPLFKALRKFERKYWTIIDSAGDANFFDPAESV